MNQRQRRGVSLATLLATLTGVSLILMTLVLGAGAQGLTNMTTSSGTIAGVNSTTTTNVRVTIDPADSGFIDTFEVKLGFDQTKVNVQSIAFSGLFAQFPSAPTINNAGGTVTVRGLWFKGAAEDPTCPSVCTLFTITWLGVGVGASPITDLSTPPNVLISAGIPMTYTYTGGTVTVSGPPTNTPTHTPVAPTNTSVPPTNTPVNPTATNTPIGPTATNTPVTPTATNTPIGPTATNTPVTPGTSTPTSTTAAGTPTNTATGTATGTQTPQGTATGTTTPQSTSSPTATGTATATPIPGGPRIYKLYLPHVADDGIPGSGQLVRDLGEQLLQGVLGSVFGGDR